MFFTDFKTLLSRLCRVYKCYFCNVCYATTGWFHSCWYNSVMLQKIICAIEMCTHMTWVSKCTMMIPVFFNCVTRFEVLIVVLTPSYVVYYMPPCILVFSNVSVELSASISRVVPKEYVGLLWRCKHTAPLKSWHLLTNLQHIISLLIYTVLHPTYLATAKTTSWRCLFSHRTYQYQPTNVYMYLNEEKQK